VSDHPETPAATPSPAETTLRETASAAAADLAELADRLPGDIRRSAGVADRISEEVAEVAAMIRSLPGRPAEMSGHDCQMLAALRTAHAAHEDVAEFVARGLARLAAELGSTEAVLSNRSGSWEAGHVRGLLHDTVGEDSEALPMYDTRGLRGAGGPGGSL
jgi:ABC-type transporter Mla subunit MlaD